MVQHAHPAPRNALPSPNLDFDVLEVRLFVLVELVLMVGGQRACDAHPWQTCLTRCVWIEVRLAGASVGGRVDVLVHVYPVSFVLCY